MKKIFLKAVVIVLLTATATSAHALNTDLFRPVADNLGTFRLHGSRTLEPYKFSIGLFESYLEDALVLKGFTTTPSTRQIIDRQLTTHLLGEIGLHDRISVGIDIPLMSTRHVDLATITTYNNHWSLGDIEVHGKFRILKAEDFPVGLTVIPFIEAPSGNVNHFSGDQNLNYGLRTVLDWQHKRFYLAANLGYRGHYKQDNVIVVGTNTSLEVDDEFTYGLGSRLDIIPNRLQVLADIVGSTVLEDFGKYERSSPIEALGGLRAFFKDRLVGLHAGGGAGINDGYGSPKYRMFAGITIQYPGTKFTGYDGDSMTKTITIEKETRIIILKGVYFETAKAVIKAESFPVLNENVEMLNMYPDIKVRIEGHCDSRGADEYNQKLSEKRAESVKQYFIKNGIMEDRLTAVGMGELRPVTSNNSVENMARNRRIELHIIERVQKIVGEKEEPVLIKIEVIEKK